MARARKSAEDKQKEVDERREEVEDAEGSREDRVGESFMYDLNVTAEERGYGDDDIVAPENELKEQVKDYSGTNADVDPDDNDATLDAEDNRGTVKKDEEKAAKTSTKSEDE